MNKKILNILILITFLTGCGSGPQEHYYLIAKRLEQGPEMTVTVNLLRRFERKSWCDAEAKGFEEEEDGFTAECIYEAAQYKPMFEGGAVGYWYAVRKVGPFSPSIMFYEFNPPLPDAIVVQQLKQMEPHTLQFAALHQTPAEVLIYSPKGELLQKK